MQLCLIRGCHFVLVLLSGLFYSLCTDEMFFFFSEMLSRCLKFCLHLNRGWCHQACLVKVQGNNVGEAACIPIQTSGGVPKSLQDRIDRLPFLSYKRPKKNVGIWYINKNDIFLLNASSSSYWRRSCWCFQQWSPDTEWCVDSWWSCHFHSFQARQWTDPGEWSGGSYRQPVPYCKCEEQYLLFYTLWTFASPEKEKKTQ